MTSFPLPLGVLATQFRTDHIFCSRCACFTAVCTFWEHRQDTSFQLPLSPCLLSIHLHHSMPSVALTNSTVRVTFSPLLTASCISQTFWAARWEVRHESDQRNNKHKTHTQAERGSMTEQRDPHKISVKDTNKSWLWLWVCNLFDFQRCKRGSFATSQFVYCGEELFTTNSKIGRS